jgi:hypothetical protein
MIIDNFNKPSVSVTPDKADAPLVVDADAVLPGAVAFQSFKPISGRNARILKIHGIVQKFQLPHASALNNLRQPNGFNPVEKVFGSGVFETPDHPFSVTRHADNGKVKASC